MGLWEWWPASPGLGEWSYWLQTGVVLLLILLAARLVIAIGGWMLGRVFRRSQPYGGLAGMMEQVLRTLLVCGVYFVSLLFALEVFEISVVGPEDIKGVGGTLLRVVAILLVAGMLLRYGGVVVDRLFAPEGQPVGWLQDRRAQTLRALLRSVLTYAIYFIAALMILETVGVRTGSILASAGIVGLAVGFGAQNLVRDIITGFFIIFEDQFTVGDYVTTAGVMGVVEELGLRTTRIREWTGQLHIIPNGEITKVTNFNRGPMLAVVLMPVPYDEPLDQVMEVLRREAEQARGEDPAILEVPVVQGVVEMNDAGVVIRVVARTAAGEQWRVERELRKRFKEALERGGLRVAFPRHLVVHRDSRGNG